MEKKKIKLTISGSSKKTISNIELAKSQGKNSVIIEKKPFYGNKSSFQKNLNQNKSFKPKQNINLKKELFVNTTKSNDFEKRKLAEQRATKRLKGETTEKEAKTKIGTKKRELKLTISRALSDEDNTRTRSLASIKRAKEKEKNKVNNFRKFKKDYK